MMDVKQRKNLFEAIPIENIGLQIRLYNTLKRNEIKTLSDVLHIVEAGPENTHTLRNFGIESFEKLIATLERGGFLLDYSLHDPPLPSISDRLNWFANAGQKPLWGSVREDIDFLLASLLSFIRQGHTSTQGDYKLVVSVAIRELERSVDSPFWRSLLQNPTMLYGLVCILAENYGMDVPKPFFDVPDENDLTTFDQVRRYALVKGNVPLQPLMIKKWQDDKHIGNWFLSLDLAWLSVGPPRS